MAESPLSYFSTYTLRLNLLVRNLPAYKVPGVYTGKDDRAAGDLILTDYSVKNSPDPLVNEPFLTDEYKRNTFGPNGGYDKDISFITDTAPTKPNVGPYGATPPFTNALLAYSTTYQKGQYIKNKYVPTNAGAGGFNYIFSVTDQTIITPGAPYQPYWLPPSFVPSLYSPYNILLQGDPVGDTGLLSADSNMMKLSAKNLKDNLQYRVDQNVANQTIGRVNILNGLKDPFNLAQILAGKRPVIARDWKITVGSGILGNGMDILQRFAGVTVPVSPIPGDYFDEDMEQKNYGSAFSQITAYRDGFVGKLLGRKTDRGRTPSELFLEYTGSGQKSQLQSNIDMNKYRPNYQISKGGNLVSRIVGAITSIFDTPAGSGNYYVGGTNRDPSTITSPPGQVPLDETGKEVNAPVYGNDLLSKMYEGEDKNFKFGLAGKSYENAGGIQGGFTWVSPKYKKDAGNYVGPGGKVFGADPQFNEISNTLISTESTNYDLTPGSILYNTQKLIDSIPQGQARFSHVGNAIDQTSKVFNDGYKEMTKGSQVIAYVGENGIEVGREYCRIFTKDTPYYTFTDLQKSDGITNYGRKFADSVLDNTYNLNIAPYRNPNSTNIVPNDTNGLNGYARKYMFSIENLAWRTSSRPGFTYSDLPVCERGPNGGRVMWFAPYDLKFDEQTTPNFKDNDFLGRPEPVYTYSNTKRTGTLSWKILVDHPSVVNLLVNRVLANEGDRERVDSIINSFYAGCKKYDLYELARVYNTIPTSELYTYQQILNAPTINPEQLSAISQSTNNNAQTVSQPEEVNLNQFLNLGYYFDNDQPDPKTTQAVSSAPFNVLVGTYLTQKTTYTTANEKNGKETVESVGNFFSDVIQDNFNKSEELLKSIGDAVVNKNQRVTVTLQGSASAPAKSNYNIPLSQRRINSVLQYFNSYYFISGEQKITLKELIDSGKIIIKQIPYGESATNVQFKSYKQNFTSPSYNCTDSDLNTSNDLTVTWYGLNAMACRTVRVSAISSEPITPPQPNINPPQNDVIMEQGNVPQPEPPRGQIDILQQVRQGISKKILRYLLSECDYFEVLKETNPFVYDSIKDKIKYFSPAFHSTTPEGLNARLTFLQQCTRPGDTIPTIGGNGQKIYNDAINTAFGAPPVLVLRIGDFWNTKIIPTGLSIKYENLDMNPEGIGVQPMIAEVSMNFNFIGGHGLKNPIERLQNALSFNFYANTEIYDERATPTVDTTALDKQIVQSIIDQTPLVGVNNVNNVTQNDFGKTIGDITTRIQGLSAETGTTTYTVFMDKLKTQTQSYYNTVISSMSEIISEYNWGVYQATVASMNYTDGKMLAFETSPLNSPIFGKPAQYQKNIDEVFKLFVTDIETDQISFISSSAATENNSSPESLKIFKKNYVEYVNNMKGEYQSKLTQIVQNLTNVQQELGYLIDCSNLVSNNTDSYLMTNGLPKIFNISGTTYQTGSTESLTANSYTVLINNLTQVANSNQQFITDLSVNLGLLSTTDKSIFSGNSLYNVQYKGNGNYTVLSNSDVLTFNTISKKREYFVMCQTLIKNFDSFRKDVLKGITDNGFIRAFDYYYSTSSTSLKNIYQKEQVLANEQITNFINKYGVKYQKFTPVGYTDGMKRPFVFSTLPDATTTQTTNAKNLYTTQNVDNNQKVYNLKKKFN
jgi:outer membrane protein OmpA-like peptidoglycan-associated protein